jgi:hypothetical protein
MKTCILIFAASLAASAARAAEGQTIDLGNGTTVEVVDGKVSVRNTPGTESGTGSVSQSISGHSGADGSRVTSVTTERNGQKATRRITVSKDGKVTVSDPSESTASPTPKAAPAAAGGWLGVHTVPLTEALRAQVDVPDGEGILVEFVAAGGPAASAGIVPNDILLSLDGSAVKSVEAFREWLQQSKPGQAISLNCLRKGKTSTVNATLGERPADTAPGDAVTSEAERLLKEMQAKKGPGRRTVVVEADGHTRVVEGDATAADPFALLLDDPNVPEAVKDQLRKTQEQFRNIQPAPAAPKEPEVK